MASALHQSGLSCWPLVELRISERFPIELSVRYKVAGREGTQTGQGKTVNMSSGGVLLTTVIPPRAGQRVEIATRWPAQLDGKCELQLVASGRVIWRDGTRFAMRLDRHEFRTAAMTDLRALAGRLRAAPGRTWQASAPVSGS